jgi:hypothetical protein
MGAGNSSHLQSGGELGAHDVIGVTAEREHQSAEQRDWVRE